MKRIVSVGIGVLLVSALAWAQQPAPEKPAAAKDELVQAWLDTAKLAAQFADSECRELAAMKQYSTIRKNVQAKVEARVPGYTVNWQTFTLVEKPAATPPAK